MAEEAKFETESQGENYSETEDNRLPYESPKLRKHGKVSNATQSLIVPAPRFDSRFGPNRLDIS